MTDKNKIDMAFIDKIKKELVEKTYYDDVKYNIQSKSRWKLIADITEAIAHIFMGMTAIMAFAAGFFDYKFLSFVAGCLGTASLVLLQFSSYSVKESKERTEQVNKILGKLGINEIADIAIDFSSNNERKITEV